MTRPTEAGHFLSLISRCCEEKLIGNSLYDFDIRAMIESVYSINLTALRICIRFPINYLPLKTWINL